MSAAPVVVAIHQPNYLPWLGYFHKIASVEVFMFLDNVQFSKSSYINRVKILAATGPKWLTIPVSFRFGDSISKVLPSIENWPSRHLSTLRGLYSETPSFNEVWPRVKDILLGAPRADLATINRYMIEAMCSELKVKCRFMASSDLPVEGKESDERLIALVQAVSPAGIYLSGKGAAGYQDPGKFAEAGLGFKYTDFQHPCYEQGREPFEFGLSILDPLFRLGWTETADLITGSIRKS